MECRKEFCKAYKEFCSIGRQKDENNCGISQREWLRLGLKTDKCNAENYICNCAYGKKVVYEDCDGIYCSTNYKFHTIEDFKAFCKQYRIKCNTFSQIRFEGEPKLKSVSYEVAGKEHVTKAEFQDIANFLKLKELQGEDISKLYNIKLV